MASVATSAIPSNNAAALPATVSASARGASTSQLTANESGFSAVLAQTNAASAKPPAKTDPLPKQQVAKNNDDAMPRITDPNPVSSAIASTAAGSHPTKSSSTGSRKPSASSGSQTTAAQQKQGAPTSPFIGGIQTGPAFFQGNNPIPRQAGGTGDSDIPPNIGLQDAGQATSQNAVDAQNPPSAQIANASQAGGGDQGQTPESPATLQPDLLATLSSDATAPALASKEAATPQPSDKSPNPTQLNALMQSLQPAAHREATTQAPQAPDTQNANTQTQAPNTLSHSSDGGSSSGGQNQREQAHGSSNNASSQSPSPDAANIAVAQSPSAAGAANSGSAIASAGGSVGGISAAVAAQNATAGASGAALHIAPTSQPQVAQPDLNLLAINIAAKSQAGAKQFDIRLDPAELGKVEVHLTVDSAGNAQAHLVAERPETLQLLQRDSATLSHALKDSGVQLGSNGLQFSLKGQERQGDGAQQSGGRSKQLGVSAVTSAQNILPISSTYGLALSQAGIDIRV